MLRHDLDEVKENSIRAFKVVFLDISIVIILLLTAYVAEGFDPIGVTTTTQFLALYLFALIPLMPYLVVRRVERNLDGKQSELSYIRDLVSKEISKDAEYDDTTAEVHSRVIRGKINN